MTEQRLDGPTSTGAPGVSGKRVANCLDAVRRAGEVLADVSGVTWLCVDPGHRDGDVPWVHVTVDTPEAVHALATVQADGSVVPAYYDGDGRLDPTWVGRVNGIRLHVEVDRDERPAS